MTDNSERIVLNDRYEIQQRIGRGGMADVFLAATSCSIVPSRSRSCSPSSPPTRTSSSDSAVRHRPPRTSTIPTSSASTTGASTRTRTSWRWSTCRDAPSPTSSAPTVMSAPCRLRRSRARRRPVGVRAQERRGPPRHQAREHPDRLRRTGEGGRLRHRTRDERADREQPHPGRLGHGDRDVLLARAGPGANPDQRSDLYSLGIVLYEMVAGRPPFTGDNPVGIAYKQVHDAPQPLNQIVADVPRPFEAIVAKLLAKKPEQRYQDGDALRDDLRRFRSGEPVLALGAASGPSAGPDCRCSSDDGGDGDSRVHRGSDDGDASNDGDAGAPLRPHHRSSRHDRVRGAAEPQRSVRGAEPPRVSSSSPSAASSRSTCSRTTTRRHRAPPPRRR